jgi:hypothetical protein
MKRQFYKTKIIFEILSETAIPDDLTIADIYNEAMNGSCSISEINFKETILNGKQCVKALLKQGSDPLFFNLTPDGNELK